MCEAVWPNLLEPAGAAASKRHHNENRFGTSIKCLLSNLRLELFSFDFKLCVSTTARCGTESERISEFFREALDGLRDGKSTCLALNQTIRRPPHDGNSSLMNAIRTLNSDLTRSGG